jgi:MFS family permease
MERHLTWRDHIGINSYWFGLNVASGVITPVLLPYLVALFVPAAQKNSYLATIRVIGLAVAMMVQPLAGMLSDRNRSRWGRRRPFILGGTLLDLLFLLVVGASPLFLNSSLDSFFGTAFGVKTAYAVLLGGIVLLQVSSNLAHGALQGLIPDLVPETERGRSSGVKAVMELLPAFLVIFIGPLVDGGRIWLTVGIIMAALLITLITTLYSAREKPLKGIPSGGVGRRVLRLAALTAIFVLVTQAAVWLVRESGARLQESGASLALQLIVVGLAGLAGMAGAILIGVYLGAGVGIGRQARQQRPFVWWVINRLLFLAAVGSIQGFAQYYMSDVLHMENAATMTTVLLGVVALFLIPSALIGGNLADRIGRRRLVSLAGLVAGSGTAILLFVSEIPLVLICGCIIGTGTGVFMATNWALGTDLVPKEEAARYLGISNLAGAGAGIVGAGIGGPMADQINMLRPGMGYTVIFAIYGALFFLSTVSLTRIKLEG